jgi:hypothetical protein
MKASAGASFSPLRNAVSSVTWIGFPSCSCSESAHAGQQKTFGFPLTIATVREWAWIALAQA